jgi:hypothetical protein
MAIYTPPLQTEITFGDVVYNDVDYIGKYLYSYIKLTEPFAANSIGLYFCRHENQGTVVPLVADIRIAEMWSWAEPDAGQNPVIVAQNIDLRNILQFPTGWKWIPITAFNFEANKMYVVRFDMTSGIPVNNKLSDLYVLSGTAKIARPYIEPDIPPSYYPDNGLAQAASAYATNITSGPVFGAYFLNPLAIALAGAELPKPTGDITGVNVPGRLWRYQPMEAYVTIKNTGNGEGDIYWRVNGIVGTADFIDTGVQKVTLLPGTSIEVPIQDYGTSEWFRWNGTPFDVKVWHGNATEPGTLDKKITVQGPDIISIDFYLESFTGPDISPEGKTLKFNVHIHNGIAFAAEGINGFIKITDLDTAEIVDYSRFQPQENTSRQDFFTYAMPNHDFRLRCEIGIENAYVAETNNFADVVLDSNDHTTVLGVAHGRGLIRKDYTKYPSKIPQGRDYLIHLEWGNFGEVSDIIFAKIVNRDTGDILYDYREEMQVNNGRYQDVVLTMPSNDLNLRIETGHEEGSGDIVDDYVEFTIMYFVPAVLNIDTIPVKGFIFLDMISIGVAPQTSYVEAGSHKIEFGPIEGYAIPASQTIQVEAGEILDIVGKYNKLITSSSISMLLLLGSMMMTIEAVRKRKRI